MGQKGERKERGTRENAEEVSYESGRKVNTGGGGGGGDDDSGPKRHKSSGGGGKARARPTETRPPALTNTGSGNWIRVFASS